jgi:hypothetical protein
MPALEAWNNARSIAAEMIDAYEQGERLDADPAVRSEVAAGVFSPSGQVKVDSVAREVMEG